MQEESFMSLRLCVESLFFPNTLPCRRSRDFCNSLDRKVLHLTCPIPYGKNRGDTVPDKVLTVWWPFEEAAMNKGELIERREAVENTSNRSAQFDTGRRPGCAQEGRQGHIGWLRHVFGRKA